LGFVHPRPFEVKQSLEYPHDIFPKNHQRAEHRSHMDGHSKRQIGFSFYSEKMGSDGQMPATAYRQIFRQALQEAHQQRVYYIHA